MNTENINIFEINEDQFKDKVLDASSSSLILVDFWAPWCEPCKQLTPILEKIINNAEGQVKLVKINIDENKQIAEQMRIQSIPAVFAFKDSRPKDAFQGVIPESQIIEFIEKNLGKKLNKDFTEFYQLIEKLLKKESYEESIEHLEEFISENTNEFKAIALYLDSLSLANKIEELEDFIKSINEEALGNQFVKATLQKIEIKKKNSSGPSDEQLKEELKKDPSNIIKLIKLSDKYFAENNIDDSFELLLNNYTQNKDKIKVKILKFFEILGNDNEYTQKYRKKFSSILFS